MEAVMLRVFVTIIVVFVGSNVSLINAAFACNVETQVCDFPSDAETRARATQYPIISVLRKDIGIDRNEALERRIEKAVGIPIMCVAGTYVTGIGRNFNFALCAIRACLSLKPPTNMTFEFNFEASRRLLAGEAVYLLTSPNQGECATAHLNRFGWRGSY